MNNDVILVLWGTLTRMGAFALAVLACYRLAHLITREDGPLAIFANLRITLGRNAAGNDASYWRTSLADLFYCPLCMGMWIALLLTLLLFRGLGPTKLIIVWLAIAGAQTFLERKS